MDKRKDSFGTVISRVCLVKISLAGAEVDRRGVAWHSLEYRQVEILPPDTSLVEEKNDKMRNLAKRKVIMEEGYYDITRLRDMPCVHVIQGPGMS